MTVVSSLEGVKRVKRVKRVKVWPCCKVQSTLGTLGTGTVQNGKGYGDTVRRSGSVKGASCSHNRLGFRHQLAFSTVYLTARTVRVYAG